MPTAKLKRLRSGQLEPLVFDYMKAHRKQEPLTTTVVAKGLGGPSAGAVAKRLMCLAEDGKVRQANDLLAPTPSSRAAARRAGGAYRGGRPHPSSGTPRVGPRPNYTGSPATRTDGYLHVPKTVR